jgi:hypothetical protein
MNKNTPNKIDTIEVYRMRIAHIVKKFMRENWAFRERLNETEMINTITQSMQKNLTLEQFLALEDSELKRRIGQRMATEGLYGLLADLTPEQLKSFDEAVAGS